MDGRQAGAQRRPGRLGVADPADAALTREFGDALTAPLPDGSRVAWAWVADRFDDYLLDAMRAVLTPTDGGTR